MKFTTSSLITLLIIATFAVANEGAINGKVKVVPVKMSKFKNGTKLVRIIPIVKTHKIANSPDVQVILPQNIPVADTNFSFNLGLNKEEIVQITNKKPSDLIITSRSNLTQSLNQAAAVAMATAHESTVQQPQDISSADTSMMMTMTTTSLPPTLRKKLKKKPKSKKKKINLPSINGTTGTNIFAPSTTLTTLITPTALHTTTVAMTSVTESLGDEKTDTNKCIDHCDPVNQMTSTLSDVTTRVEVTTNPTVATVTPESEPSVVSTDQSGLPTTTAATVTETTVDLDSTEASNETGGQLLKSNSDVELDNLVESEVDVIPITLIVDANLMIDLGAKMLYEALDHKSIPQQMEEAKNKTLEVIESIKSTLPIAPVPNLQLPSFDLPWNPADLNINFNPLSPNSAFQLSNDQDESEDGEGEKEGSRSKEKKKNKLPNNFFDLPQLPPLLRLPQLHN